METAVSDACAVCKWRSSSEKVKCGRPIEQHENALLVNTMQKNVNSSERNVLRF